MPIHRDMPGPALVPRRARVAGLLFRTWLVSQFAVVLAAQTVAGIPIPSAVAVDARGAIYLAGTTSGTVPTTTGVFQPNVPAGCAGSSSCVHSFVAMLNPTGDQVAWATYLSSGPNDLVAALEIGPDGAVYVAGAAVALPASRAGNPSGMIRRFVAKLSPDGRSLPAATFWGGSGTDFSNAGETIRRIAFDTAGNVFVAGTTASSDFPTTPGAYQRTFGAMLPTTPGCSGATDEFVTKFDRDLKTVLFSTLAGTTGAESLSDFALGPDGSMYLAGSRLPLRDSPCTATLLLRLNPQGTAAIYSFSENGIGGGGFALAVDGDGAAYLGGDDRAYGLVAPSGQVSKLDGQGRVVGEFRVNGYVRALRAGAGGIAVLGEARPDQLTLTADAPGVCRTPEVYPGSPFSMPYVARLDPSSMKPVYLGTFNASRAWSAGIDEVVALNPYGKLLTYAVLPVGPPLAGTVTCVASAATYESSAVAPGELISLYGVGIGPVAPAVAQAGREGIIASELGGIRVMAGSLAAPILYAGPGQINLAVPFSLTGETVHFRLYRDSLLVTEFDSRLTERAPGFFGADASRQGPLAALNQDGSVNRMGNPAAAGSVVTVFVTGLGTMTPQLPDGAVAAEIANAPVVRPRVMVNQEQAEVLYMGNAPSQIQGVVQINLRLPAGVTGAAYVGLTYEDGATFWGGTVRVEASPSMVRACITCLNRAIF